MDANRIGRRFASFMLVASIIITLILVPPAAMSARGCECAEELLAVGSGLMAIACFAVARALFSYESHN